MDVLGFYTKNSRRIDVIGLSLSAFGSIGMLVASISSRHSGAILDCSTVVWLVGLAVLLPWFMKTSLRLLRFLWKAVKQGVYEIFYEATKGIQDAKNK